MTTIVFRSSKGSNLTANEVDTNFFNCKTDIEALQAQIGNKANLASPAFTGVPTAPTASPGTNTQQLATMAAIFAERSTALTLTNHTISGLNNTLQALPANQIIGVIPIANLATGTPTGSKFIRDDGTLQAIAGGGDALVSGTLAQFAPTTSTQLRGVITDETGTGSLVFAASPAIASPVFSGTFSGTFTMPATATLAATPSQGDNSTKLASTAYVDTLGAGKVSILSPVSITGSNTLTSASHFNRHISWTGSSTAAQAISATATQGDYIEVTNSGTALLTFTGSSAAAGYELQAQPGETFYAIYDTGAWISLKSIPSYISPLNVQTTNYTFVTADAGRTIHHPLSDGTPRTYTIPSNASVPYPIGTVITIDNDLGAAVTIAITSDTLVLVGAAGSTGSRTLAAGGRAVAQKVLATRWRIAGGAELT